MRNRTQECTQVAPKYFSGTWSLFSFLLHSPQSHTIFSPVSGETHGEMRPTQLESSRNCIWLPKTNSAGFFSYMNQQILFEGFKFRLCLSSDLEFFYGYYNKITQNFKNLNRFVLYENQDQSSLWNISKPNAAMLPALFWENLAIKISITLKRLTFKTSIQKFKNTNPTKDNRLYW